jgi:hypothetical protein
MQQLKLIQLYFYVCQVYEEELKWHCERFSNNGIEPIFTDQELLTTYLFCVGYEQRFQVKQIHQHILHYWRSWFPNLPSYATYNDGLNRLVATFPLLVSRLLVQLAPYRHYSQRFTLTDSMPIMTCSNRRKAKVARQLCDKGYNSVKKRHFYGVKLHAIGLHSPGHLPFPEYLQLSPASEHDLEAQRPVLDQLKSRLFFGDKAFRDKKLDESLKAMGSEMLTPVVYQTPLQRALRPRTQAADDLYSLSVSSIRQPIESFFNWLIEKTDLQRASKVRSQKGLLVHIFGKIAAAIMVLVLNAIF